MIVCPQCSTTYEDAEIRFCGKCGSDMGKRPVRVTGEGPDPLINRVIDGRYRIIARLGQGGMGAVYRVEHVKMGKIAAMKLLHPGHSDDREVARRFRQEAESVSKLEHPNTVQVFDFGEADGMLYLVMELVRGEDLGAVIRRDGPLPFPRVAHMLMQVCEALGEAHELGIVHRDLKPENLMLSRSRNGRDVVKVLDFGLAKLRDTEEANRVTARGSLIGTPYYMSPEQIRADALDARSDIYSLGGVAYRMLTGEPPFEAATPVAVLTKHLTDPLIPPSRRVPGLEIPPAAERVVVKALAKKPEDRYASAEALRRALEQALSQTGELRAPDLASTAQRRAADASRENSLQNEVSPAVPLKREDFDAYERQLKRQRVAGGLVVPMLLAAIAVGAFFVMRAPSVHTEENEPNNDAKTANPIASGVTVKGRIGRRIALEESDRDFYVFKLKGHEQVVRVASTGIPGMDTKLSVYDGSGARIADADNTGPGEGETLAPMKLAAGEYYVATREVWVGGRQAMENISDWYRLTATWGEPEVNVEYEPNDEPAQAVPLVLDTEVTGTLGALGDRDCFYLRGDGGGKLTGTVSGIAGVDMRVVVLKPGEEWKVDAPRPKDAGNFEGKTGEKISFNAGTWAAGTQGPIIVVERKDHTPTDGTHAHARAEGLATPYRISVQLK